MLGSIVSFNRYCRYCNRPITMRLTLQLPFCFEVRPLSCSLVGSAPKGPSDDVRGFDPRSMKSDGNAADFLE